jgi:hypothetical protein
MLTELVFYELLDAANGTEGAAAVAHAMPQHHRQSPAILALLRKAWKTNKRQIPMKRRHVVTRWG